MEGRAGEDRQEGPEAQVVAMHTMRDNLDNLARLHQVHEERLLACREEITQLKKFRADYVSLQKRLKTLPDKTTHEVMVPFGRVAFMPGRLVHTNEVLVLLGDNWFAERSAKQALDIVRRRLRDCDEKIKTAEATEKIHVGWLKETADILRSDGGQVEITENITEEEYKKSQEDHRASVVKEVATRGGQASAGPGGAAVGGEAASEATPKESFYHTLKDDDKRTFDDIIKRLDELELEEENAESEEENDDEEDVEEVEEEEENEPSHPDEASEDVPAVKVVLTEADAVTTRPGISHKREKLKRRVSWADDRRSLETIIPDNESEEIFRIQYTSSRLSPATEDGEVPGPEESAAQMVRSPSDLVKLVDSRSPRQDTPPRGILKKSTSCPLPEGESETKVGWRYAPESVEIVNEANDEPPPASPAKHSPPMRRKAAPQTAFNYKVVERQAGQDAATPPPQPDAATGAHPKRVSKFKAARTKN